MAEEKSSRRTREEEVAGAFNVVNEVQKLAQVARKMSIDLANISRFLDQQRMTDHDPVALVEGVTGDMFVAKTSELRRVLEQKPEGGEDG